MILFILAMGSDCLAQDISLKGRSALGFSFGFWGGGQASVSIGTTGIQTHAGTNGFMGSFGYSYWLREYLALTLTTSMRAASSDVSVNALNVSRRASAVFPVLLGLRFYVPEPDPSDNIRPYLSAAVGPYFGAESANTLMAHQAHLETSLGGSLGGGIDFFLGNHFMLGAGIGYHLMANFQEAVGGRNNYNGGEFHLGVGYIF